MEFNDILRREKLDKKNVLVMRHSPTEKELRKVFPWLAAEKHAVFNMYQRMQPPKVEKQLQKADYLASFIGHEGGKALFVGIYEVRNFKTTTTAKLKKIPENKELESYGHSSDSPRTDRLLFELALTKKASQWKGKLFVKWPPPDISWTRWADNNVFEIEAILPESCLEGQMPNWRDLRFTWEELQAIPKSWRDALSHWRAIYFIFDTSDGKGYVGSAYGSDNLLGRWRNYAKKGHGGNKLLKTRDPKNFLFSILERVSPDMSPEEIIQRENTWKARLHTCEHGLNVN